MRNELAQALAQRGVLGPGSRIMASCPVEVFGGVDVNKDLILNCERIRNDDGSFSIIASHRSGRRFNLQPDQVMTIDGMDPVRLARAYDIKETGQLSSPGRKRGRKPRTS
jgi:hypothetical protein